MMSPIYATRCKEARAIPVHDTSSCAFGRRPKTLGQRVGTHQLESMARLMPVYFLHIQLAHKVDRFLRNHLAWYHDWKAGRVRNDEVGGNKIGPILHPA